MQDLNSGAMRALPNDFKTLGATAQQLAKDAAIPNRKHQGSIFSVGEIVEVKGARFRVNGIGRRRLYLESLPSAMPISANELQPQEP